MKDIANLTVRQLPATMTRTSSVLSIRWMTGKNSAAPQMA